MNKHVALQDYGIFQMLAKNICLQPFLSYLMSSQTSLFILINSYSNAASFSCSHENSLLSIRIQPMSLPSINEWCKTIRAVKFKHHYIGNFHRLRNTARIEDFTINSVKMVGVRLVLFHMLYFNITLWRRYVANVLRLFFWNSFLASELASLASSLGYTETDMPEEGPVRTNNKILAVLNPIGPWILY